MKIDFQFALNYETYMSFFTPVWLDKFRSELKQTNLFIAAAKNLETGAMNPISPFQRIEQNLVLIHHCLSL